MQSQTMPETLTTLLTYHIGDNNLPKGSDIALKEMLLLVLGLGGLNYVPVAYENGDTATISIINAVTTAVLGEILLYLSGKIYYDIKIAPQHIPSELENVIEAPLTKEAFFQEVMTQVVFAAASAIPLATTLFDADLEIFKENPWLFWLALSYIEIVNTAMHLVPIELTMRDEFYGFLPSLLMRFYRWLIQDQLSSEAQECQAQLKARADILSVINPILINAKENFLNKLAYENVSDIQEKLTRYKQSPNELLSEMLACYVATPPLNPALRNVARFTGGIFVSGACLGYAANPYLVFKNDFHFSTEAAIGTTLLPIYFFMVLMTFFGDGMGVRALKDFMSLSKVFYQPAAIHENLPTVAKLYPTLFVFVSMSTVFAMIFTGAPGREMMKTAYNSVFAPPLMHFMMWVVNIGIGLLTLYAALDFSKIMLSYFAQYLGSTPKKDVAIIKAKIEALIRDINRIKPEYAENLGRYIQSLVPPSAEETQRVSGQWCACWSLGSSRPDDTKQPLMENVV